MRRLVQGRSVTVAAFVLGLVIATAATATASRLITGKQIKDGSISARDLAKAVRVQLAKSGATGPAGAPGAAGPQGERGVQGDRGPSEAAKVTGPAPVNLVPGTAVEVASLNVTAGAYTVVATGFVYSAGGPPVDQRDQFSCAIFDAVGTALGGMPSQITLDAPTQFTAVGAGNAAAGPLRVICTQVAVGGADSAFTEINARLVATRVGTVTGA